MSAKTKAVLLFLLCTTISTISLWLYYQSPNSIFGSAVFIVVTTSGSGASFFLLYFIILFVGEYKHRAERDRVTELNRHVGKWNSLLGDQMSLYSRTRGDHSPEAETEWKQMTEQFQIEEIRHNQVDAPIMERHQKSELFRSCLFMLLFLGLISFVFYGMFAFP